MPLLCEILSLSRMFVGWCASSGIVSLYHHDFSSHLDYSYSNILNYLKLHTLSARRRSLDVLFERTFTLVRDIIVHFWKLLAFTGQIGILET